MLAPMDKVEEEAMMPDKVRNYLVDRIDSLQSEINALETERLSLLEMLEDKTPSILPNAIKRYSAIESGYRVLFKNKNAQEEYRCWTYDSERDRTKNKLAVWPSLSGAQDWINLRLDIYDLKIIDKDGYEVREQ